MPDDSQGGLRGDPVLPTGPSDGTRDQICIRCNQLEAARDHLRARLRSLHEHFKDVSYQERQLADAIKEVMPSATNFWKGAISARHACAADLLAVLTEPPQEEKSTQVQEKKAVTRSAETDVIREVPLPQREDGKPLVTPSTPKHKPAWQFEREDTRLPPCAHDCPACAAERTVGPDVAEP